MKVIEVKGPGGRVVYLEVDDQAVAKMNPPQPPGGGAQAGVEDKAVSLLLEMEKIGDIIASVCGTIEKQVRQTLKDSIPTELSLEFGVKLAGEAGVPLVTKGTVEGTFKVTAKWTFAKPTAPTGTVAANDGDKALPAKPAE